MSGSTVKRAAAVCAGALAVHLAQNCYAVHSALRQHTREARECARSEGAARDAAAQAGSSGDGGAATRGSSDSSHTAGALGDAGVPVPTGDASEAVSEQEFKRALDEVAARMGASDTVSPLDRCAAAAVADAAVNVAACDLQHA